MTRAQGCGFLAVCRASPVGRGLDLCIENRESKATPLAFFPRHFALAGESSTSADKDPRTLRHCISHCRNNLMPQNPFTYGNDDNQAEQQGWGPSGPRRSKTAFLASVFPVQQATPTQRQLPGAYAAPLQGEQQAQQPQGNFALSFNDEFAFLNSQQGTTPAFSNCPSPFFNPSPGQHDHT